MRDTVKFDPSIPDRQVTGESSTSQHTCSSASQTEYLDVQSLSSASSYMALPSLKHGKKHIPLSALGPPGPSSRRTGCSHSHCRCEEESIMQNMCNKRNERLSKPCKDGFCYCFTSDSEDFRKDPGTSAGHHRCKALRKEYAYHLPTESDCSEIVSSDQYFADKQKEKKKKRVSLPPEILESGTINRQNGSAGCGHKDGKCSNDNCRRRPFLATNKFQEFHCSDSDAPLIHIVQEVQRNVVVSEIRINRSKLKKSKVRSKSAGRSGDGSRNAEASTSEKIINAENLIDGKGGQVPEKLSNKTEGKDASTNTTALKNKQMQSRATNVPSQSEDDGIRTDLIKARPRSNKLKGGRLLMKRVGPDVSYRPIIGPPRKPPRNFSSSPDCSSSDISAMSIGDQPTMPASFRLPQETDDSFNGKDNSKKVSDDSLNSVMNQKSKVTKITFDKLSGKVDSNGAGTSPPTSEGGYSRPAVASSNIAEESFETGPSSRQEFTPTCPPYSEIVSPDTTDINELLRMLPSVPTGPVIVNDSLNKLNIESATHPKNIEFAEVNVVPAGEISNPEQVGWVPPAVYNMLSNETANQKFVSQHPVAEPQQVGWQPPPRLQIDTVDSGQKTSENENSHNFAENMELKSTPVKPDIPRNEMTPKNILREKVKNLPQPPSKPQRQNQTPKMATVREVSPSGEEELTVISSEPKDSALYPKLSSPIPVESNPIVNPISVKPKESTSAAESVTVATTVKDSVTEKESTTAKEPASTPAGKSFQKRALKHTKSFLESLGFSKKKDGKDDRKSSNKEAKEPPKMVETVATQTNDTLVLQSRRLNFDYASDDTLNRRSITPIAGEDVSEVAKPTHHSDDGFDFSRKVQSPRPERSSQRKPFSPRNFLKNLQPGNEKVGHDESYKSYASDLSEDFTVAVQDLLGKARAKLEGETTAAETVTNTLTDESVAACTIAARADVHPEPVYAEIREVDDDGRARLDIASRETSHQGPDKDKIVYAKVVKKGGKQTPLSPHRPAPLPPGDLSDKEQGQWSGHSSDGQDKPGSSGTFKQTSQPRDSQSNIQERSTPSDGGHAEPSQSSLPTQLPRGSQPTQIVKPADRPKQSPPPVPVDMSRTPAAQIVRLPTPPHHSPSHSRRSSSSTSSSRGLFSPHLDEFFSHGPLEEVAPTLFGRQRSSPGPIDSDSSGGGNLKRVPPSGLPQQSANRAPPINRHGTDENYHDDNFKQQKPAKRGITSEVEYANIPSERFHQSDRPSGTTPQVGHPTHSTQQGHIRTRRSVQEPYSTDLIQAERNHPYGPQSAIHINPSDPQHFQSQNLRITPRSSPQGQSSPDQDDFREVYGSVNPEEYSGVGSQSFYSIQSDQYGTPMGWHQAQPIPGQPTRHNRSQQPTVHFAPGTGNQAQPMPFAHRSDHAENQGHVAGPHGWHQMQQPSTTNAPHNLQAVGSTVNQNEAIRVQPQGWHQTQPTLPQTRDVHQPQPSSIATRLIHQEQIQRDILPEDNEVQRTAPAVYPNIVRTQPVMPPVEEEFRDLPEYSPATVQSTRQHEDVAPCVPERRRRSVEDPKVNSGPNQSEVHIVQRGQVSRKSDYQDQQQSEDSSRNKTRNIRSTNDHPITSERQNVPMTPHSSIRLQEVDYVAMLPSPPQNISMGNPPVVEYGWPASGATVTYPASSATNIPSTSSIATAGVSQPTFSATDATPSTSYTTVADAIPSTSFATAALQANSEQFIETERPLTSSTPQPPATVEPIPSTSFNNSHEKDSPPRARVLSKSDLSQTSDIFLENLHHKNVNVTQYSDRSDDEKRSNLDSPRAVAQFFYYDSSTGNGESSNSSFCRDPLGNRRQTSDGEYEDPCCGENCPHLKPVGYDTVDFENESPETGSFKSCRSCQDKDENMNNSTSKDLNLAENAKPGNRYASLRHRLRASFRKGRNYFKKKRLSLVHDRSTKSDNDTRSRKDDSFSQERKGESDFEVDYISAMELLNETAKDASVKRQLEQTVSICRKFPEFEMSPEMVEAERLLLYSSLKEKSTHFSNESLSSYRSTPKDFISGSVCVTSFEIPIKPDIHHDEFFNYFYIGVFTRGQDIRSTQSAENVDNAVFFSNCNMLFENLSADFQITVDLYVLRLRKLSSPPTQNDNTPVTIRKSSLSDSQEEVVSRFRMHGNFNISALNLAPFEVESDQDNVTRNEEFYLVSNNIFTLPINLFPRNINLTNEVWLTASATYCFKNFEISGFLNVGEVNGKLDWNKRWCQIDALTLYFWNYPQDCTEVSPILKLDLTKCVSNPIRSANREICPKPRSFQLEFQKSGNESNIDRSSQIFLFSAESQEEYNYWVRNLNDVLEFMRTWKVQVQ